jgi:hypothetical protein
MRAFAAASIGWCRRANAIASASDIAFADGAIALGAGALEDIAGAVTGGATFALALAAAAPVAAADARVAGAAGAAAVEPPKASKDTHVLADASESQRRSGTVRARGIVRGA